METPSQPPTRRQAVAAAAAILPFAAVRGSAANSAPTVGLLGSGGRGTFVAERLAKHTPGRVVALCDLFEERMAQAKERIGLESPRLYTDLNDLLASDVDAVIVATPVYLHPEHLEAAVRAGKHVYIEKPAAVDVEGCKRVMRAADAADRKLNIVFGFQRRYAEVYRKAKALADSGEIGSIRMGLGRFIKSGSSPRAVAGPKPEAALDLVRQWHSWKELSGDLIVENNVHVIDVMNWFLGGRPLSAIGAGGRTVPGIGDMRDHNFIAYQYPAGVGASLAGSTLAPPGYRDVNEQFFGERGTIETAETHWTHFRAPGDVRTEKAAHNGAIDAVREFVRRIAEADPENTGVRGAESTLTAILGRMAMDARREVSWDEMMSA